jgi:hypothetical protein
MNFCILVESINQQNSISDNNSNEIDSENEYDSESSKIKSFRKKILENKFSYSQVLIVHHQQNPYGNAKQLIQRLMSNENVSSILNKMKNRLITIVIEKNRSNEISILIHKIIITIIIIIIIMVMEEDYD